MCIYMWYVCIYMYSCAYMCVHACVHRCLCICVWTHMCNVYIPRYWTSHPVQKYPSQLVLSSIQGRVSAGSFVAWHHSYGGLGHAHDAQPIFFLNMTNSRRSKGRVTMTEDTVPSKGHPRTHWAAKLQETLRESCLSKYSWLAVLFTDKFSQSTWGDFCLKKKKRLWL